MHNTQASISPPSDSIMSIAFAWLAMLMAVIAASTLGPAFKLFMSHGLSPAIICSWRGFGMCVFLIPLAWLLEWQKGSPPIGWSEVHPGMKYPLWVHLFFAGLGWAGSLMFWIEGLRLTTTVHASVLATTYPLMLVVVLSLGGVPISILEKVGVITAMVGLVITSFAAAPPSIIVQLIGMSGGVSSISSWASLSTVDDARLYLLGDTLCLMSAVCETAVILNRQQTRVYVPLFTYTAATTAVVAMIASIIALFFGAQVFCLQDTCLLGWLHPSWAPYLLSYRSVGAPSGRLLLRRTEGVICYILKYNSTAS